MKSLNLKQKSTQFFLIIGFVFLSFNVYSQNITITDDDGYSAHESAMLDIQSTTKGLLIPRLTTTEREDISPLIAGLLVFDTSESTFYYYDGSDWVNLSKGQLWNVNSNYVLLADSTAKVGIGTYTPNSKLEVKADNSFTDSDTLFAVKDKDGNIVFAVFPDGAKVYVNQTSGKAKVGGFAVSGRSPSKAVEEEYLRVTPDSTRVWVNSDVTKAKVGGFAVSGRSPSKGVISDYLVINEDSTRIYVNDTVSSKAKVGGFAVSGRSPSKGIGNEILLVTSDSTRVYINEPSTKAKVGGFAVSGRSPSKGLAGDYFNVSANTSADKVKNEKRMMWYPQKAALLAGEVHVGSADSVGLNSTAIGYRAISKGDYSQAMGYKAQALAINSTAIGNYAIANTPNSYALGDSAIASGVGSFAIGSVGRSAGGASTGQPTTALGKHSVSIGMGAKAEVIGAMAIGNEANASGVFSNAYGFQTSANGDWSTALGYQAVANSDFTVAGGYQAVADGEYSVALGYNSNAGGTYSQAIGYQTNSQGDYSQALGKNAQATGINSTAVGNYALASAEGSFSIGDSAVAIGIGSYAFGSSGLDTTSGTPTNVQTIANGNYSVAFGFGSYADKVGSYAMGINSEANGKYAFSIGTENKSNAKGAYTLGSQCQADGQASFAIGYLDTALTFNAFAIGAYNKAIGISSFALGFYNRTDSIGAFAIGNGNIATRPSSFAFGTLTKATGKYATSFGNSTEASGGSSTAMGWDTHASGYRSFAGGWGSQASGEESFAYGLYNQANGDFSTALGNTITVSGTSSFGIGLDIIPRTVSQNNTFAVLGGKVGINTSTPDYDLDIAGYLNIGKGIIGTGKIVFRVDGDEALWYNGTVFSWGAGAGGASPENGYNYFQDPVGIGISTRDYWLSVAGTANLNSGISSGVALRVNGDEAIYYNGSRFNWGSGGTYNYFADPVGIGTTSTTASKLNISGTAPVVRITMSETDRVGQLIRFADYIGDQGNITLNTGTVSYNAFTGSHYAMLKDKVMKGMLIASDGTNTFLNDEINSEIIYGASVSVESNAKNIIGAYLGKTELEQNDSVDLVMAVGNGVMWVVDNGEDLDFGDYLISSAVAGHAMKDKGEYLISNVVARIAEPVNWQNETEMINGVKHKLVSVFFENFTISNSNIELENKINELEQSNKELIKRIESLENKVKQ